MGGNLRFTWVVRVLLPVGILLAALVLASCGGGASSGTAETAPPAKKVAVTRVHGTKRPPRILLPSGPPPKKLVVKQLRAGIGARAHWGQRLGVQFVGVNYRTGKVFEAHWGESYPFTFNFGSGEVRKGWEIGLKGIRVGGSRKLLLPSRLAYDTGALLYVVELVEIQ